MMLLAIGRALTICVAMAVGIEEGAILFIAMCSTTLENLRRCRVFWLGRILHRLVLLHALWCQLFFGENTVHLGYISNISIQLLTSGHCLHFELAGYGLCMTFIAANGRVIAHGAWIPL